MAKFVQILGAMPQASLLLGSDFYTIFDEMYNTVLFFR